MTRGIIEKPLSMAHYKAKHDRKDERSHYTYEARVKAAAMTLAGHSVSWVSGKPMKANPWAQQKEIRDSWREIAAELYSTGTLDDKLLAQEVISFVESMPPIQTQQERIAAQLLALRSQTRMQQNGKQIADEKTRDDPSKGRSR